MKLWTAAAVLLLAGALASAARAEDRAAAKILTRKAARERSERVSGVRYDLFVSLLPAPSGFSAKETVAFQLRDANAPLTLDFSDGRLGLLRVNGVPASTTSYNGYFLTLASDTLRIGANTVEVGYSHPYSTTSEGLYRFEDAADSQTYVYTDFEPYNANALFPCFDQPDLKGTYSLRVLAPQDWSVVSNTRETSVEPREGEARLWTFPASAPLSTYVFNLDAGPFAVWTSTAGRVPLRLFARKSLAPNVEAAQWLKLTAQGLAFYQDYFGAAYPFGKYDQLLVPDFNSGAMENAGAVTFAESYIFRGKPTWAQREDRANTILHEMAHMWFGDLVTMDWWDDLWLNESFATYMAALSLHEATEFKDSWLPFFQDDKGWGYAEDELVTTHPIEADAPDTESAFADFDGITYGKGAAVLKQAAYLLGPKAFRGGVRLYLKRHAFANARHEDFLSALQSASGRPLETWAQQWLATAGTDSVEAVFDCKDGRIASFKLLQSAPAREPTLRSHRAAIALWQESPRGLIPMRTLENADYSGPETPVPALLAKACPALVWPNAEDQDYAAVALDETSLKTVEHSLNGVDSVLERAMLWQALWQRVRDGRLPLSQYSMLVRDQLPRETIFAIQAAVAKTIYGRSPSSPSLLSYLDGDAEQQRALFAAAARQWERFFWDLLAGAKDESDAQALWFESYVAVARSSEAQSRLIAFLNEAGSPPPFKLDQDRRWTVVAQLCRIGAADCAARIAHEKIRDASHRGALAAITSQASMPDPAVKDSWTRVLVSTDSDTSLAEQEAAMAGLFPYEQAEGRRRFAPRFFAVLAALGRARGQEFAAAFARSLAPATCRAEDSAAIEDFLKTEPAVAAVALKELKVAAQENDRCVKVRALALKTY